MILLILGGMSQKYSHEIMDNTAYLEHFLSFCTRHTQRTESIKFLQNTSCSLRPGKGEGVFWGYQMTPGGVKPTFEEASVSVSLPPSL